MNEFAAHARNTESTAHLEAREASSGSQDSSFQSLVETSIQGIIVHRDWQILFANRAAVQALGYAGSAELTRVGSVLLLFPEGGLVTVFLAALGLSALTALAASVWVAPDEFFRAQVKA